MQTHSGTSPQVCLNFTNCTRPVWGQGVLKCCNFCWVQEETLVKHIVVLNLTLKCWLLSEVGTIASCNFFWTPARTHAHMHTHAHTLRQLSAKEKEKTRWDCFWETLANTDQLFCSLAQQSDQVSSEWLHRRLKDKFQAYFSSHVGHLLNLLEFHNTISPLPWSPGPETLCFPAVSVWSVLQSKTSQECFEGFSSNFEQTSARTHWRNSLDFGGQRSGDFPFHVCERSILLINTHAQLWPFFLIFINGVARFFQSVVLWDLWPSIFCFGSSLQGNRCQLTCDLGSYYNGHRKTCEACHPACATCAGTSKLLPPFRWGGLLSPPFSFFKPPPCPCAFQAQG